MAARTEFSSLTGMHDLLPPQSWRARALVDRFAAQAQRYSFAPIRTPILEDVGVFGRLGAGTDVVTKEMYAFTDRDGTEVCLRPESTAGVARSFLQHRPLLPWRVWYHAEHFRHEKPQKGRHRQHHQVGCEVFGPSDPDVDAEVIVMLWDFYRELGLNRIRLLVNSIGEPGTRAAFAERLRVHLRTRSRDLGEDDRAKIERNPLRVLDSKDPQTLAAIADAPRFDEEMSPHERAHFARVLEGLDAAGVPYTVEPRLVRGLDYYTHTVFEIVSDAIDAAQSTIGGGGRYDGLVEALGGEATPAVGFGSGVERVLLACDAEGCFDPPSPGPEVFVVTFGGDGTDARDLCLDLRRAGIAAERSYGGRSPKAQMKAADRSGAPLGILVGDDERAAGQVTLRDLLGDDGQRAVDRASIVHEVIARRGHRGPDRTDPPKERQ